MCIQQILNVNPVACNRKYLMWRQEKYGDLSKKAVAKLKNLNGDIIERYWPALTVQIQRKIMEHVATIVSPRDLVMQAVRDQHISIPRLMPYCTRNAQHLLPYVSSKVSNFPYLQCNECSRYVGPSPYPEFNKTAPCNECKRVFCMDCLVVYKKIHIGTAESIYRRGTMKTEALCIHCDKGAKTCAYAGFGGCKRLTNGLDYCPKHTPQTFPFRV